MIRKPACLYTCRKKAYTHLGDVRFSYKNVRISYKNVRISYKFCKKTVLSQICSFGLLHFCSVTNESKLDQFWMYWWWRKCNSKKKNPKKNRKNSIPESWPSSLARDHSLYRLRWARLLATARQKVNLVLVKMGVVVCIRSRSRKVVEPGCVYAHINKACIHIESFTSLLWLCSIVV